MRDGFTDHTAGTKLGLILGAPPRQVNEHWRSPCGQRSSILAVSAFQEHARVVLRAMHGAHFNMTEDRTFLNCVEISLRDPSNSSHGVHARTRRISPALIGFAFLREEHFMHRGLIGFGLGLAIPVLAFCQRPHRVAIRAGALTDGTSSKRPQNSLTR